MGEKTDRATGKVKETAGRATGDRDMEQEGRDEHTKGKLKQGAKNVKEAVTGD
jgi:uncharacterized protein YjbJ (UPF0337 family)